MLLGFSIFDPEKSDGCGSMIYIDPEQVYAVGQSSSLADGPDFPTQKVEVSTARVHVAPGDSWLVVDEPAGSVAKAINEACLDGEDFDWETSDED